MAAEIKRSPLRWDLHLLAQQLATTEISPRLARLIAAYRRHPTPTAAARLLLGARDLYLNAAVSASAE